MSSPATMSSNSSVSGGGDDEDNGGAEDKKHRKFRKKRLGRPPKDKHSPARYPKRSRTANNNSADNSDEDVNDDAAVSARDGAGGAGAEGNSCVGEVIDSDSSSRKSEIRLVS